jgi:hypothetical protein
MGHGPVAISDLTVVEMRSLLARRRREKHVDSKLETRVFATFEDDIRRGFLIRHPIPPTGSWPPAQMKWVFPWSVSFDR